MDRMIYLSMSGAKAALQRQDSLANNLANVSTNGFRAELTAFRAVPIRGDGGPITVPQNASVDIAEDGTITAKVGNQKPTQIGKLKLVTPEVPMNRGTDGLFRAESGDLNADPAARLQSGALEGSNVSPVATMVGMIAAARQFEHQMKMLENAEKQDQTASKLLSEN